MKTITVTTLLSGNTRKHEVNIDQIRRVDEVPETTQGYSCIIHFSENDKMPVQQTYNEVKELIRQVNQTS